jgi:hypothetical protein
LSASYSATRANIGKKLAEERLGRGLALMTRVRKNMKSLPVSLFDKALLNGRNVAETIIGHIKEFSSLRLPKHRSVLNALTHIVAATSLIKSTLYPLSPFMLLCPGQSRNSGYGNPSYGFELS